MIEDICTEPRPPSYQKHPHRKLLKITIALSLLLITSSGFSYYLQNDRAITKTHDYSGEIIRTTAGFEKILSQEDVLQAYSNSSSKDKQYPANRMKHTKDKIIASVDRSSHSNKAN